jgi:endonuclease G, mitochondrial
MKAAYCVLALLFAAAPALADCPAAPLGVPIVTGIQTLEICHTGYLSLLDPAAKESRIVTYGLTAAHSHAHGSRAGMSFKRDTLAPPEDQGRASDYAGSGFDLGHLKPAEDGAYNQTIEEETFRMTNVVPQLPHLNRDGWEELETVVRAEACARGVIAVFTGPIYDFKEGAIGKDRLPIPSAFFKVAVDPKTGWAIAFIAPQADLAKGEAIEKAATSIRAVEMATGIILPLPETIDLDAVNEPEGGVVEKYRHGECG